VDAVLGLPFVTMQYRIARRSPDGPGLDPTGWSGSCGWTRPPPPAAPGPH